MNRRQFTASLGAACASTVLPLPALCAAAAPAALPPATYTWAHLIARARGTVSPDLLARQLRITPQAAEAVFQSLVRDGVIRAPTAAGVASAVKPMQTTGHTATMRAALKKRLQAGWEHLQETRDDTQALVKDANRALGCEDTLDKENANASPDQSIQESSRQG